MSKNVYICDCNAIHKELVDEVINSMPDNKIIDKLSVFYKLLGDNTRCKILYCLDNREMCVCDLANVLSMSKSSISHQLSTLRNSGVVKLRKQGKEVYYSLDDNHVSKLFEIGLEHIYHKIGEKNENTK